jgi:hypothetical protein
MRIVTGGTAEFRQFIELTQRACDRFCYECRVYDFGGLGFGTPMHVTNKDFQNCVLDAMPSCLFKPRVMKDALSERKGGITAWLDGDAVLLKPLDDLEEVAFDIAVTLREAEMIGKAHPIMNYLNAGVIFFRDTQEIVDEWERAANKLGNDQLALNQLIGPGWTDQRWLASYHTVVPTQYGKALILPAAEWNFSQFPRPFGAARIAHFKGVFRGMFSRYFAEDRLA